MKPHKKDLTDSEVKNILERIPMTKRLPESECAEMTEDFLHAIRKAPKAAGAEVESWGIRPLVWIGFGATAAACALGAVFFLGPQQGGRNAPVSIPSQNWSGEKLLYKGDQGVPQSATEEISTGTAEIESPTRVQVNQVPWESLCGPRSVWVAAARSGVNLDLGAVIASSQVTREGCSLWSLKEAAESFGLIANGMRLDWDALLALEDPAVLPVKGNHFACVDAGELSPEGAIRYYDPPHPSSWISREALEEIWKGEALVLSAPFHQGTAGPAIRFETVLEDLGDVVDKNSLAGSFPFQNLGNEPLEILEVNHSCGCIQTEISKNPVLPGETAEIVAELGLQGIDGARSEMIEIRTNDPTHPSVTLVLQAHNERTLVVSSDFVDFGIVSPSMPSERTFVVEDFSKAGTPIQESEVILNSSVVPAPSISVRFEAGIATPEKKSRATQFQLSASVSPETPLGIYEGTIQVVAGRDGDRLLQIAFQVKVESDYLLTPSHISFGVVRQGEEIHRSLSVRNRANKPVRLIDHKIEYETTQCSLSLMNAGGKPGEEPIDLTLSIPEFVSQGTTVAKGALILRPEQGPELEVPWSAIVKEGR